ncbi:MAG: hypothetical protein ABIP95_02020 [Pelobium sp.]
MKWVLRFFALLDIASFFLMFDQAITQLSSFLQNETLTTGEFFSRSILLLLWLSLLISAVFLAIPKKAGIIIYYFQLIPRMMFLVFSLGFVSLLSYLIAWEGLENMIISFLIFTELLRAYYSFKIQKELPEFKAKKG